MEGTWHQAAGESGLPAAALRGNTDKLQLQQPVNQLEITGLVQLHFKILVSGAF